MVVAAAVAVPTQWLRHQLASCFCTSFVGSMNACAFSNTTTMVQAKCTLLATPWELDTTLSCPLFFSTQRVAAMAGPTRPGEQQRVQRSRPSRCSSWEQCSTYGCNTSNTNITSYWPRFDLRHLQRPCCKDKATGNRRSETIGGLLLPPQGQKRPTLPHHRNDGFDGSFARIIWQKS